MGREGSNGSSGSGGSIRFSKTEQMMVNILADGRAHPRKELHACCGPSRYTVVGHHISNIRKKLPAGTDIVCVARDNQHFYQWVRLLASPNDGRN